MSKQSISVLIWLSLCAIMACGPLSPQAQACDVPVFRYALERWPTDQYRAITSATKKSYPLTPVRVTICSLKCSDQPEEAEAFMKFIASEKVAAILENYGFGVSDELRRQEYQNGEKRP